jgi:uncharacterized cupin superfamily protein
LKRVNIGEPDFRYDDEDPDGFRSGMFRPREQLGPKLTGVSVYEIPPGQALCPYHYEISEEEWLLVLAGEATVRTPEGEELFGQWDMTCFPVGPEGAHEIRNDTGATIRILMFSNVETPAVTVYPDSEKVGAWTGNPEDDVMVHKSSKVGYYSGEPRLDEDR